VVDCLPSMYKALGLISSTEKTNILLGFQWISYICRLISLIKFGIFAGIISSNIFYPFLLLLDSGNACSSTLCLTSHLGCIQFFHFSILQTPHFHLSYL
jgi:hypothetical protein